MSNVRLPNINHVILDGRLVRDAELKFLPSGGAVVDMTIANDDGYMKDGQWVKKTAFVGVKAFGKAAERAGELRKGDPVVVEGKIVQEEWQDRETGQKRSKTLINAFRIMGLTWPDSDRDNERPNPDQYRRDPQTSAAAETQPEAQDDIPF